MTLTEGSGSVDVGVSATLGSSVTLLDDLEIALSLSGATRGTDYTLTGAESIRITAGSVTGMTTLTITPTADDVVETEAIEITGTLFGYTINPVMLPLQDRAEYTVSVPSLATVMEGDTTVTVEVTVAGTLAPLGKLTVPYTLMPGTATAGKDYTDPGPLALEFTVVELDSGTASKDISITITDDTVYEGDETFMVELGLPTGATGDRFALGDPPSTVVTITEDDTQPDAFALIVDPTSLSESDSAADVTVTVTVTGGVSLPEATEFSLAVGGSAMEKVGSGTSDYMLGGPPGPRTLTVPAEALMGTATLRLTPVQDTIAEGDETILFTATVATASTGFTTPQTAELTLTDDDTASTVITLIATPATLTEGSGSVDVGVSATLGSSVTLLDDLEIALSLSGATRGTDYTLTGAESIRITAGSVTGMTTLTITPTADDVVETEAIEITGTLLGYTINPVLLPLQDRAEYTVSVPSLATVMEGYYSDRGGHCGGHPGPTRQGYRALHPDDRHGHGREGLYRPWPSCVGVHGDRVGQWHSEQGHQHNHHR